MKIARSDERTVEISELNPFLLHLLEQIVAGGDEEENERVRARLYPAPTRSSPDELNADWKEYVEPDLRRLFQSAREVVKEDLQTLERDGDGEGLALSIPVKNLPSWLNALNQARLGLGAAHDVGEAEMADTPESGGTRALAIFQIHFYGYLQECFVREWEKD